VVDINTAVLVLVIKGDFEVAMHHGIMGYCSESPSGAFSSLISACE